MTKKKATAVHVTIARSQPPTSVSTPQTKQFNNDLRGKREIRLTLFWSTTSTMTTRRP
uniref:Uncharacterized protein n=1 Tax=Arundo donax TaxID=35708 RepID=A0A0A9D2X9_ARUDO